MKTITEWGIRHQQGIARYRSQAEARQSLRWHYISWQESQWKNLARYRPVVVSRTVSAWDIADIDDPYARSADA